MENPGPVFEFPDELPPHLLRYLEEVKNEDVALKEVFQRRGPDIVRSNMTGRPFEFVLRSTGEVLQIQLYKDILPLILPGGLPPWAKSDTILVAAGRTLPVPVILARGKTFAPLIMKAWKGRQGYDDTVVVEKKFSSRWGSKTHGGIGISMDIEDCLKDDSTDYGDFADSGDDGDDDGEALYQPRRSTRLSSTTVTDSNESANNREPSFSSLVEDVPYAEDLTSPSPRRNATTTAEIPISHEEINVMDFDNVNPSKELDGERCSTTDTSSTVESYSTDRSLNANARNSFQVGHTKPAQDLRVPLAQAHFDFYSCNGMVVRSRDFSYCNTITKLFAQATAAGTASITRDDCMLTASIQGGENYVLVQGDDLDFQELVDGIKKRANSDTGVVEQVF